MNILNRIKIDSLWSLLLVFLLCACGESGDSVVVSRICSQKVDDLETELTRIRLGETIRIEGSGFSTTKVIYCNGKEVSGVNRNYITDTQIILTIPESIPLGSEVEDPNDLNTLRIVTEHSEFVYSVVVSAGTPTITGISHTLPEAGDVIEIYGTNLRGIDKIIFPGGVVVEPGGFIESTDYKTVRVTVPEGGDQEPGYLTIEGVSGGVYSYNYMNCKDGIFINRFSPGNDAYSYGGSGVTSTLSAVLPEATNGEPGNPEFYRGMPAEAQTISSSLDGYTVGILPFDSQKAWEIALTNGLIDNATLCDNVAIQFDYYVTCPWSAGAMRWEMISGDQNFRNTTVPWVQSGEIVPITFNGGWRTLTMPLNEVTGLKGITVASALEASTGKTGRLFMVIGNFQVNGTYYRGISMSNFQFFLGNVRIVPYVKKYYNN